jgi:Fic family protein
MDSVKKWIWQHDNFPNFTYQEPDLKSILSEVSRNTGKLEGTIAFLSDKNITSIEIEAAINEIIKSSEIEGEILGRDSVRSSVRKRLDKTFDYNNDSSTRHTDGLVGVLLDSSYNHEALTEERLHGWHNSFFPTGYSDGYKIDVAKYRSDEIKVVSQKGYRETVHYVAPPHDNLAQDMKLLLDYINHSKEDPYIKSAIAHIWFTAIHPYDDGNGRIGRAITNYVLSKELGLDHKYYSISNAIRNDKKGYYNSLEKSNNLFHNRDFDFTNWVSWHTNMVNNAINITLETIQIVVQKTKFWDRAREQPLNERQIKVINKILGVGIENFEGGLSTKKYASITKTSTATAKRDINELLKRDIICQVEGSAGRNTRYELNMKINTQSKERPNSRKLAQLEKQLQKQTTNELER